jgi:hypothetical protein
MKSLLKQVAPARHDSQRYAEIFEEVPLFWRVADGSGKSIADRVVLLIVARHG